MQRRSFGILVGVISLSACGGAETSGTGGAGTTSDAATATVATGQSSNVSTTAVSSGNGVTNGGTTTSASTGSGGVFDPSSLPGVELWLVGDDATVNGVGKISTWSDRTFYHHDATQLQNAALQPARIANAPGFNGHTAVRFSGCNGLNIAQTTEGIDFDTQNDSYVAVAASFQDSGGPAFILSKDVAYPSLSLHFGIDFPVDPTSTNPGGGLMFDLFRPPSEHYAATTATLYHDSVTRVYSGKMRAGQLILRVNGAVVGTASSTAQEEFITGAPLTIGSDTQDVCLNGDIGEMFIIGNPDADTDGLETWLMQKYGI